MPWWVWIGLIFLVYKLLDRLVRIPITSSPNGEKDHVLITGCDSGFGNLFSKRLASKGFHVYAGCLTATGKQKLEEETPSCLKALLLDVTQPDSIRAAYDEIARFLPPGKGLWAVINNAGVAGKLSPTFWQCKDDFIKVMDVNYFGPTQVVNTFLPLVKKSRGRIVNTSSVCGRFPISSGSSYTASKHAMEGYSGTLRLELAPFGVSVHLVEPGKFQTPLTDVEDLCSKAEEAFRGAKPHEQQEFGEEYLTAVKAFFRGKFKDMSSPKLHLVVDAYEHAVLGAFPRGRYLVGNEALFMWLMYFLPEWLYERLILASTGLPLPAACKK